MKMALNDDSTQELAADYDGQGTRLSGNKDGIWHLFGAIVAK